MPGRGVLFALTAEEEADLLAAAGDDDRLMELIAEIEDRWDEAYLAETDKAWDAIHRVLTDGRLDWDNGERPLNAVILGGSDLYEGDDYIAVFKNTAEVQAIDKALDHVDGTWIAARYRAVVPKDYAPEYGEDDLNYTVEWFDIVKGLYKKAAAAGRSVLFTVDQ